MSVRTEAGMRLNAIFIDDPQAPVVIMLRRLVAKRRCQCLAQHVNQRAAYDAKLNVWKVLSQPWSACPRSVLRRGTSFIAAGAEEENDLYVWLYDVRRARAESMLALRSVGSLLGDAGEGRCCVWWLREN